MMKSLYQQQLMNFYKNQCKYLDSYRNFCSSQYINMLEDINNTGFVRLSIIDQVTKEPIPYATITFYVTNEAQRDIPIMHLVTTINPVRIELPMANELGTKIAGPEYDFSTYNISIDVFGYFTRIIYNIRLFPNTTTEFEIEMVPITQIREQPFIEERTDIPPHPRDVPN
ncbi:MAG: hypothetical protein AB7V48_03590 [Sedimentibacter sp.]